MGENQIQKHFDNDASSNLDLVISYTLNIDETKITIH